MANLTASVTLPHKGDLRPWSYGMVGYTDYAGGSTVYTIYKGSPVCMDVSDVDGYAQPFLSGITAAGDDVFLGVALEEKSVTSADTAQGDKEIAVARGGVWGFPKASLSVTDIGAPIYADDSQVVTSTDTSNLWIGTLVDVDDTYAWVDISHATGRVNSAT